MTKVVVIGCGVVGATIAYELSRIPRLEITVLEENLPASGSTGAALGVLMGAIAQKFKGRLWKMREISMKRYETLIPELEALTNMQIPFNRQGILKLVFGDDDLEKWSKTIAIRKSQGWELSFYNRLQLQINCPHIEDRRVMGAIYSPQDRQINPIALTQALIAGAKANGVEFRFGVKVNRLLKDNNSLLIETDRETCQADCSILAAGCGSTSLLSNFTEKIVIRPVLGQAIQVQLDRPLGSRDFQPVITGNDVHIVPLEDNQYAIGATVEFANELNEVEASADLLEKIEREAISFCPLLAHAKLIRQWSGMRPRPEGISAPIVQKLPEFERVILATGHYRNGVLLAPATAQIVQELLLTNAPS